VRKIVTWLIVAAIIAFIADYYGYISIPWGHREGPNMIEMKKTMINKSENMLENSGD
jgi:hypothetical protein